MIIDNMNRLEKIKSKFDQLKIDSFLVKNLPSIRYLSGFSGSAASVVLTKEKNYFITDFRYKTQSQQEVSKDFEIIIYTQNSNMFLKDLISKHNLKRTGFESNFLTYAETENLNKDFSKETQLFTKVRGLENVEVHWSSHVEFVAVDSLIENITIVKNENE